MLLDAHYAGSGGKVACSYNEHSPPWHDRTWQPQFEFAVVQDADGWTAEFALPFDIFCKNKTLASEIGFNVRRFRIPGQEVHCWHGTFDQPGDWGILTGIPARDSLPAPDYVVPKPDSILVCGAMGRDHVPSPAARPEIISGRAAAADDFAGPRFRASRHHG